MDFSKCQISYYIPFIDQKCTVDGYVGSYVMIENDSQRIWNFTLEPGQMTSMHRHDFDYSFVAIKPSRLEVFGEDGTRLFDFWATESSLKINGDFLEPTDENIKVRNIWGFFSSRSLKTREKYISFAQFVYFLREVCLLFNF